MYAPRTRWQGLPRRLTCWPFAGSTVAPNPALNQTQPLKGESVLGQTQIITDTKKPTKGAVPQSEADIDDAPTTTNIPAVKAAPRDDEEEPTQPRNRRPQPSAEPPETEPAQVTSRPPRNPGPNSLTPSPGVVREALRSYSDYTDPRFTQHPARRTTSRWIFGVVLIAVLGLLALTVGRRYLEKYRKAKNETAQPTDARVSELLAKARKLRADSDFEAARESLDKASALAERDPAVLRELALLEAHRADSEWLRLRLLDPEDKRLVKDVHRRLGGRVGRAQDAVRRATAAAPSDPDVIRSRIDVLRLAGKLSEARALVKPIAGEASKPENAYVLAALDLAEPAPGWESVVERLRLAAAPERGLGRRRCALIYALARSGDLAAAKSEFKRASDADHPLYADLSAFLERYGETADAATDAGSEVKTVDPASLPVLDTTPETQEEAVGDFRSQLRQASAALKRGDLDRAEHLYRVVLKKHPGNTEALSGLGAVAELRRDPKAAAQMYDKVLKENPSYLPALKARADQKWNSGDKAGALVLYRRLLDQAGQSSPYGRHAAGRIAQGAGSTAKTSKPPSTQAPPEPSAAPTTSSTGGPHIDTTDLPEEFDE